MSKVASKQNLKDAIYENNLRFKQWVLGLFPNKNYLDKIGEEDSNLTYNGQKIVGGGGGISDVSADEGNIIEVREDGIYAGVPTITIDVEAIIEAVWDSFTPVGYQYIETSDNQYFIDADNSVFLVLDPSE